MKLGFVILGADHWHAPWHLNALLDAGQQVLALSGADAPSKKLAADKGLPLFGQWEQVLERFPDALPVVLTKPNETPAVLSALVDAKKPFVLEKPGTIDAAALLPALEGVARAGLATLVPMLNRNLDFWAEMRGLAARLRPWDYAHFRILAGPPQRYRRDGVGWVLDPAIYGGGALRNLGIHSVDAALDIAGDLPLSVEAATLSSRLHNEAVEDFCAATLSTPDGRRITIEAGYCMPTETTADKEWRAHGPGWAVSERNGVVEIRDGAGLTTRKSMNSAAHYRAFGHTMAALARGERPALCDLAGLYRAQALADAIYAAGRQ